MSARIEAAGSVPPAQRHVSVETPEQVRVDYELADLGSRFVALLLDGLLLFVLFLALALGWFRLLEPLLGSTFVVGWVLAIYVAANFLLFWGYFMLFEGLPEGQTPGKRAMRIRTVHDGGYPLTFRGAAIRNLLRLVDIQPMPSWAVGGLSMMLHPRTKRLGDMAAGTVVVRERAAAAAAPAHAVPSESDSAPSPRAAALVSRRRPAWREYRGLLERARKRGLSALPESDVSRFAALYRGVAADLARARSYDGSPALRQTLERWTAAGHNVLYRPERRSGTLLVEWLREGFPALVRLRSRPILIAAASFFVPAVIAFTTVRSDPAIARNLLPRQILVRAEESVARQAGGEGYVDVPEVFMPVMASSLIANNVQVTFLAFAGGVLAGLGTLAILILNGVFLGAVAALFTNYGTGMLLWTFVAPHGVIELTAICLAGGAGLWLGSGLVLPGRLRRRDALVRRAREAVSLLAGTTLLLMVAGLVEGFISPAAVSPMFKFAFAGAAAVLLFAYLLTSGRGDEARGMAAGAAERDARASRSGRPFAAESGGRSPRFPRDSAAERHARLKAGPGA